ncbi:MAG: Rne/Rng family ribonuclease [Nocardioides sp.]
MADDELQDSIPLDTPSSAPAPDSGQAPADGDSAVPAKKAAAKKAAAKKAPAKKAAAKKTATKKAAAAPADGEASETEAAPVKKAAAKKAPAKKAPAKKAAAKMAAEVDSSEAAQPAGDPDSGDSGAGSAAVLFQAPDATAKKTTTRTRKKPAAKPSDTDADSNEDAAVDPGADSDDDSQNDGDSDENGEGGGPRRRRRRGGRRRRKNSDGPDGTDSSDGDSDDDESDDADQTDGNQGNRGGQGNQGGRSNQGGGRSGQQSGGRAAKPAGGQTGGQAGANADDEDLDGDGTSRRRRRRRREGDDGQGGQDDPSNTTTRVRRPRNPEDEITAIAGSTRLEAKKQRRREGRDAGRRRAPIVSEAEFLARREAVDRVMVVRQREDLIQIGVLEDKVLVEHYVARESQTSLIGNIYLGRVQNVLPSMEAAFVDIGKGRNAVIYAGEVNWSALGHKDGAPRKIESVLSSGQTILVQVTKDPIGHKGARLTSQISLAGRFLVYVPDGTTSGISRKLPDTERNRLKTLLKEIVPDTAGVIVRTAAEGASEDELTRDVERLKTRWDEIEAKTKGGAPQLLYGEPDLMLKVVRDLFTEDFAKLVVQGDDAWATVKDYVLGIAPDLEERLEKYDVADHNGVDVFGAYRIDEQIAKAIDRKVWLPSGGSLIIDRTEAMTVVDVNTGKFTGSGGNLEETVTKNNLEAAEEVVRQLRLRDIGGIIVVDFIDMVLESNRDLVLRRLVECLGRDRTRHQVAEVTSLGLVQMTRKRIGTGLVEAFSENCEHCQGRGLVVHDMPVEPKRGGGDDEPRRGGGGSGGGGGGGGGGAATGGTSRRRGGRSGGRSADQSSGPEADTESTAPAHKPTPAEFAAMAKAEVHKEEAAAAKKAASEPQKAAEPTETVETAQAPEPAVAEQTVAKPAAAEPEPATPVEPVAPQVVTRTRRGVSRTVATAPPPTPVEIAVQPAQTAVVPETAPEPPKVVTRTRGRAATRVAGPPADASGGAAATGEPAADEPTIEHVPIKKKGTRKR